MAPVMNCGMVRLEPAEGSAGSSHLEIQTKSRDKLAGRGSHRSRRDAPEGKGIDVEVRICEHGMVQNIDRINPQFELFGLGNPHTLDQVHVQAEGPWSLDPVLAHRA